VTDVRAEAEPVDLLAEGEIRLLGLLAGASNHTFLVEVADGERSIQAVYKPRRGERPLWDFPKWTLHRREVAAYRLAEGLGWPAVPATVLRDGPAGVGAVQAFVDADPSEHFFTLRTLRLDDFRPVAAFDVVANNADRKSGHCLLGRDGRIWSIDHGLCFGTRAPLRSVIWQFAGTPVPDDLLGDVRRVAGELRSGPLREAMAELLSVAEVDATAERAEALLAEKVFPFPGAGRTHPWPLV
jgi:uncharacterized repeat protein (TIGR03843 family)